MIRVRGSNLALNSQRPGDPVLTRRERMHLLLALGWVSAFALVQGWESVAVAAPSSGPSSGFPFFPFFVGAHPAGLVAHMHGIEPFPGSLALEVSAA